MILVSFKKYVHSKLLIFDPSSPLFIPAHFTCTPAPLAYICYSDLPQPLSKNVLGGLLIFE